MEVITIESEAYKAIEERFSALEQKICSPEEEKLLDNQDVCWLL